LFGTGLKSPIHLKTKLSSDGTKDPSALGSLSAILNPLALAQK